MRSPTLSVRFNLGWVVLIRRLVIEEEREDHIARHNVSIDDVFDIVFGVHLSERTRDERIRLTGQTRGGRYLTLFVASRGAGVFGLVTARDATDREHARFRAVKGSA